MPASHVNDSKHWRDRAAEMRALSDMMKEPEAIAIMLRLLTITIYSQREQTPEATAGSRRMWEWSIDPWLQLNGKDRS